MIPPATVDTAMLGLVREDIDKAVALAKESADTAIKNARELTEQKHVALTERVNNLCTTTESLLDSRAELRGKASQNSVTILLMFSVIGMVGTLSSICLGLISLFLAYQSFMAR